MPRVRRSVQHRSQQRTTPAVGNQGTTAVASRAQGTTRRSQRSTTIASTTASRGRPPTRRRTTRRAREATGGSQSEDSESQDLEHIQALIRSEIQRALGATPHHSSSADATSQSGESSSNQVLTVTSGSNPATVPIVSSSAGSVSGQLECDVCACVCVCMCVSVCVCACGCKGTEASIETAKLYMGYLAH